MQKNKRKFRLSLLSLVLISSLFLITSSGNSMAWETFKADYWQTGNMFQDIGKFDVGYTFIDINIGSLYQPLAFENPDVSNQTILVMGASNDRLYAFNEVSGTINTIDSIVAGDILGQLAGFDKELNDNKFEVAGIFDINTTDFFRVFEFNGTSWSLLYNFTTPLLVGNGEQSGVTCREYNGVDYCVFVDGNGTLYEVNIDTKSYTSHIGLGRLVDSYYLAYRNPVIESIRSDGTYQAIFQSDYNYDGDSLDLVSWDLTNDQLDANFGGVGGDPVGVVIDAYEHAPTNPLSVAQLGVSCSWFLGLYPYDCQPAGHLEIIAWAGADQHAYVWDSAGSVLDDRSLSYPTTHTAGNMGLMDCNDDGRLDIVVVICGRDVYQCHEVTCLDGYDHLSSIGSSLDLYGAVIGTDCFGGTGLAIADLDADGDTDIAISSGAYAVDFDDSSITRLIGLTEFAQAPIIADFDGDSFLDLIYTNAGITKIYMTNATNQNPQFIDDGTEVDTCVPLCLNSTITFYARKDLDYTDDEGDNAYLGVNCYGLGFANITWSSLATDPEVTCTYNSLGYWSVPVYITDSANFPSYSERQSFGIYTSLGASCYDSGEWQEECDPVTEVDEIGECFTDSGISVCLVSGTSSALCEECDCYSVSGHRCPLIINGTEVDSYVAVMFDWDECDDWKGSMWYGACPLFVWATSLLGTIWDWIFSAFWIFLTLILVMVIVLLIFKKVAK